VKDGDSIEELKQATEQLSAAIQKAGAAMYQEPPQKEQGEEEK
jgi:hypothetical protein